MTKYKAIYTSELITQNACIKADEFSCISFENIGTDTAVLDNVIPLDNVGVAREFIEKPFVFIDTDFKINFSGVSTDKRILVTKTFYKEIIK